MSPPNRNFGDAIVVQDLNEINVWNILSEVTPPLTKILEMLLLND